jgi:hypothetical protein
MDPVARIRMRRLPGMCRQAVIDRIRLGKEILARVIAMLARLIDRFDVDDPLIRKD